MKENYIKDDLAIHESGLNFRTCCNTLDNGSYCGAMAVYKVPMPKNFPDMPVCSSCFKRDFSEWTREDSNEILNAMMEEIYGG